MLLPPDAAALFTPPPLKRAQGGASFHNKIGALGALVALNIDSILHCDESFVQDGSVKRVRFD
jgi:hypothetical protein